MAEQPANGPSGRWEKGLTWGDEFNRYEVELREADLLWVWLGPKDMGGTTEQTFVDYLADGPKDGDIPFFVRQRLDAALEAKLGARWKPLQREAQALRAKREADAERRRRETAGPVPPKPSPSASPPRAPSPMSPSLAAHDGLPWMPQDFPAPPATPSEPARPTPLWKALLLGAAVYAVGVGVPVLVMPTSALGAGFLGLFLPVLAGFGLSRWNTGVSTVVAGFFGLAGALALLLNYGAALAAVAGEFAALGSVAEAPAHGKATRFTFGDAELRPALRGEVKTEVLANKSRTVWVVQAAPLVPARWAPGQPVPAFVACETTPGFDCLGRFPHRVRGAVLTAGENAAAVAQAVQAAVSRHGLAVVPGAPVLEPVDDPDAEPKRRWVLGLSLCLLTWLVWAGGVVVAHARAAWRARKRPGLAA